MAAARVRRSVWLRAASGARLGYAASWGPAGALERVAGRVKGAGGKEGLQGNANTTFTEPLRPVTISGPLQGCGRAWAGGRARAAPRPRRRSASGATAP